MEDALEKIDVMIGYYKKANILTTLLKEGAVEIGDRSLIDGSTSIINGTNNLLSRFNDLRDQLLDDEGIVHVEVEVIDKTKPTLTIIKGGS